MCGYPRPTAHLVCCRRLFPETRDLLDEEEEVSAEFAVTNTEIASSLPLQMLLYFNVQYSIFWGLITLALMVFKVVARHSHCPLKSAPGSTAEVDSPLGAVLPN